MVYVADVIVVGVVNVVVAWWWRGEAGESHGLHSFTLTHYPMLSLTSSFHPSPIHSITLISCVSSISPFLSDSLPHSLTHPFTYSFLHPLLPRVTFPRTDWRERVGRVAEGGFWDLVWMVWAVTGTNPPHCVSGRWSVTQHAERGEKKRGEAKRGKEGKTKRDGSVMANLNASTRKFESGDQVLLWLSQWYKKGKTVRMVCACIPVTVLSAIVMGL